MTKSAVLDVFREELIDAKVFSVDLPIPPSVNSLYMNTRGGGKRLSRKAESYIRDSRALINLAIQEQSWVKPNRSVWLYADMVFYFPDRRVRDSHNCLKLLLDVMQGIVYRNDYFVLPRIQSVKYDKDNPRVKESIYPQSASSRTAGINN